MKDKVALGGSVAAAIAASLCCVGPLLAVLLGVGTFSAAAVFAAIRPYLLGVAGLLLAIGFYRAYFRRQECAPGEACATKPINRAGHAGLWIVSVLVLAFALSPYYLGYITARITQAAPTPATLAITDESLQAGLEKITVRVEGMTCTSCEDHIREALKQTPGVRAIEVSYKRGDARIEYDPKQINAEQIRRAIDATGYKAIP
jgi:copper chaperone CopZ